MMGGMGIGPMGKIHFLDNEKVQKELELTDEQKTKVAQAVKESSAAMGNNIPRLARQNLGPGEMQAKMLESMKKSQDQFLAKIGKILLPKQLERLKQIYLQAEDSKALMNPDVIKALKITGEQQAKIKSIIDEAENKIREEIASSGMIKSPKDLNRKLLDVLTAEQRAEFENLKGAKFDSGSSNTMNRTMNSQGRQSGGNRSGN